MDPQPYSEEGFWDKLAKSAKDAGRAVVERALQLYYAAQAPETPTQAKVVIYSALAYFILPTDAIPDLIPLVGYTDDLGALVAAYATVSAYITPDIVEQAQKKADEWFGAK